MFIPSKIRANTCNLTPCRRRTLMTVRRRLRCSSARTPEQLKASISLFVGFSLGFLSLSHHRQQQERAGRYVRYRCLSTGRRHRINFKIRLGTTQLCWKICLLLLGRELSFSETFRVW